MKTNYSNEIHSLAMCDFRIKHWEKAIEKQEKIVDPSPKELQDLKTNRSLLDYWKKYKKKHHG